MSHESSVAKDAVLQTSLEHVDKASNSGNFSASVSVVVGGKCLVDGHSAFHLEYMMAAAIYVVCHVVGMHDASGRVRVAGR